jgi:hypothetical protein
MVLQFVVDGHTTCFGLYGHLQVCKIFSFLFSKESAIQCNRMLQYNIIEFSIYTHLCVCMSAMYRELVKEDTYLSYYKLYSVA